MRVLIKLIAILALLFVFAKSADANVKIKGIIVFNEANMEIKNVSLEIYKDFISPHVSERKIVVSAVNEKGEFLFMLEPGYKTFYIGLYFSDATNKEVFPLDVEMLHKPFIYEDGDSLNVKVNVRGKWITYVGKGSEKLNCQFQMESVKIQDGANRRITDLINNNDFLKGYNLRGVFDGQSWNIKYAILKSYEKKINPQLYNRIYLDSWFGQQYKNLESLLRTYSLMQIERNKGIIEYAKTKYISDLPISADISVPPTGLSQYYRYLFKANYLRIIIKQFEHGDLKSAIPMATLFEQIKTRYSGLTRDYLFLLFFMESGKYQADAFKFLDQAKEMMYPSDAKEELLNWELKTKDFSRQNFTLMDASGKTYALNDYKGKVVVLDFWFYGCSGCLLMTPELEKIIKIYRNRNDIIFISVNSDGLNTFNLALKNGGYASPDQLTLYTSGLARHHPLIEFFNMTYYPTLMIIGKDGNLVSSRAPDPRLDNGLALQAMIDKLL